MPGYVSFSSLYSVDLERRRTHRSRQIAIFQGFGLHNSPKVEYVDVFRRAHSH